MIAHEQRGAVGFQKRLLPDVGIGVVNEGAGFYIAAGVDVAIVSAAGNAAANVFSVVPEIYRKQGLPSYEQNSPFLFFVHAFLFRAICFPTAPEYLIQIQP